MGIVLLDTNICELIMFMRVKARECTAVSDSARVLLLGYASPCVRRKSNSVCKGVRGDQSRLPQYPRLTAAPIRLTHTARTKPHT
jgi:hypothetical protein